MLLVHLSVVPDDGGAGQRSHVVDAAAATLDIDRHVRVRSALFLSADRFLQMLLRICSLHALHLDVVATPRYQRLLQIRLMNGVLRLYFGCRQRLQLTLALAMERAKLVVTSEQLILTRHPKLMLECCAEALVAEHSRLFVPHGLLAQLFSSAGLLMIVINCREGVEQVPHVLEHGHLVLAGGRVQAVTRQSRFTRAFEQVAELALGRMA